MPGAMPSGPGTQRSRPTSARPTLVSAKGRLTGIAIGTPAAANTSAASPEERLGLRITTAICSASQPSRSRAAARAAISSSSARSPPPWNSPTAVPGGTRPAPVSNSERSRCASAVREWAA